jgi:hypothetical protein
VAWQDGFELGQGRDVLAPGEADHQLAPRDDGEGIRRRLPDGVDVLLPELEPEPGVDERRVGRGDEDMVVRQACLDPRRGRDRVQLPGHLRLAGRVARRLDPDVRAPGGVPRASDHVADDGAVALRDPGAGALGRQGRPDLPPGDLGRLVGGIEGGLGQSVPAVSIGEERGGGPQVARFEGPDREPAGWVRHGRGILPARPAGVD